MCTPRSIILLTHYLNGKRIKLCLSSTVSIRYIHIHIIYLEDKVYRTRSQALFILHFRYAQFYSNFFLCLSLRFLRFIITIYNMYIYRAFILITTRWFYKLPRRRHNIQYHTEMEKGSVKKKSDSVKLLRVYIFTLDPRIISNYFSLYYINE